MTEPEILAHNRGVMALAAVAAACAEVLRGRLTEAPTRFSFAIAALEGIVEAADHLTRPPPPSDDNEHASSPTPRPTPPERDQGASVTVEAQA